MSKSYENINIADTLIENYDIESIVVFLSQKLKRYNSGDRRDEELAIYVDILTALANKLIDGESSKPSVVL